MALPVIADVFRVALHWQNVDGGYGINVLHFRSPTLNELGLRTALNANWTNAMQQTMSSEGDQDTMQIIALNGVDPTLDFDGVGNSTGQGNDQALIQVATMVNFKTGTRGPQGRGRIFMPFVAENMTNAGRLDGTARATQETAWNTFIADMLADDAELVVASYRHSTASTVLTCHVAPIVGTQKRRVHRVT